MFFPYLLLFSILTGGEKVVINEFSYDDSGTDDREFVELYNASGKDVDIGGWRLESNDQVGPNTGFTIPANTILKKGDYYVLGSALVPNVDQVVGTTNIWENDQESLILRDADGNVVDSLTYEANKGTWPARMPEGEGIWGNHTSIDAIETSWARLRDGYDTNNNRDFRNAPWTPGTSNNLATLPALYTDNFDAGNENDPVKNWGGSFALGRLIDPAKAGTYNPNPITASPQGGKAAIFWDSAGGGNHNMLLFDGVTNVVVEAYVYFDAKFEAAGEREVWSIGVQGTSGTYMNFPDPSGAAGFTANGNTGVTATFEVTDRNATLYLVDHNDGGLGSTAKTATRVLGKIDLRAGVDDGWQRMRLQVDGNKATLILGTGGAAKTVSGTISTPSEGGVYVSYREGLANNSVARPLTMDDLTIVAPPFTGSVDTTVGVAKQTTKGTPRMGTNGAPIIDNGSFAITGVGLVPSGTSLWGVGLNTPTAIDLTLLGGQAGSFLYLAPIVVFGVSADAEGDASVPVSLPNTPAIRGSKVDLQILDPDPAIPAPATFKVGTSRKMTLTVG